MILVLQARLPALWVVIVRHVEPGVEQERGRGRGGGTGNTHKVIIRCLMEQL